MRQIAPRLAITTTSHYAWQPLPRGIPHRSTSNRASRVTFKDRLQLMYLGMAETWVPSCSVWFVKAS